MGARTSTTAAPATTVPTPPKLAGSQNKYGGSQESHRSPPSRRRTPPRPGRRSSPATKSPADDDVHKRKRSPRPLCSRYLRPLRSPRIGSQVPLWWLAMLIFQGEGTLSTRSAAPPSHPMWEWLLLSRTAPAGRHLSRQRCCRPSLPIPFTGARLARCHHVHLRLQRRDRDCSQAS